MENHGVPPWEVREVGNSLFSFISYHGQFGGSFWYGLLEDIAWWKEMVVPQLSKTLYRLMWNPGFSSFSTCLFSLTLSVLQTLQPRNHSYLSLALAQSSKNTEYKTQGKESFFFLSLSLRQSLHEIVLRNMLSITYSTVMVRESFSEEVTGHYLKQVTQ